MKKVLYFTLYVCIGLILWLMFSIIAYKVMWEWASITFTLITFIALFPIAWGQAGGATPETADVNEKDVELKNENVSGVTFRITSSYNGFDEEDYEEIKKSKWVGSGDSINIQGYTLEEPFIYISKSNKKSPACHIIPTKLKAASQENYDDIGYWPSYSNLKPSQRNTYLKWIAEGKEDQSIDIGYVFIYFYGLEYRALIDNKDLELITKEVIQLWENYSSNNSFRNYSEGLLGYLLSNLKEKDSAETLFSRIEPKLQKRSQIYKSGINMQLKNVSKLSADEVISSISGYESVKRSSIPDKVGPYFIEYFKIIARAELQEAISILKPKKYNESYRPASNFLHDDFTYKGLKIIVDRKLQKKLAKKWAQAVDAFRPYSRQLSKKDPSEIYSLLPAELRKTVKHPNADKLEKIEDTYLDKIITLQQLADLLDLDIKDKIKQKDAKRIVDTLLSSNLIIEPNPYYFKKTYKLDDKVIISKSKNASMLKTDNYKLAALMADFGVDLAYADNNYADEEAEKIYSLISSDFLITEIEKEHLKLRVALYKELKPKMNGVFKKLSESLSIKDLKIFSSYLIKVALADGVFSKEEDSKIRSALSKLGLDTGYINELYSEFDINSRVGNVSLRKTSSSSVKGSTIPTKTDELSIDREKLSRLTRETAEVKSVLSGIIALEDIEKPTTEAITEERSSTTLLNSKHQQLLSEIIQNEKWDKKELKEKAKKMGLMLNAAISKINNWAEEEYGDFLIFEDDFYIVQKDLITEEKSCA